VDRAHRINHDLIAGNTWIAWRGGTPAATITTDRGENPIWPARIRRDPAVYVSRLVVSRSFAGRRLGAALLDWAGLQARRTYGARWVRVDVWTTNIALHTYYEQQGFAFYGYGEASVNYPSAALYQKTTEDIRPTWDGLFRLHPPPDG
jgi:GNAT superfamily N-acetyltransferase